MPTLSVARAAVLIKHASDATDRWNVVLRLVREVDGFNGPVPELLAEEPKLTGDSHSDVALAAAAELVATRRGRVAPTWTRARSRYLDLGRWVGDPDPTMRAEALIWTPPSFRRRGLLATPSELRLPKVRKVSNEPGTTAEKGALSNLHRRMRRIGIVAQVYVFDVDSIAVVACRAEAAASTLTSQNVASIFCDSHVVDTVITDVTRDLKLADGWLQHVATRYCRRNPSSDEEYFVDHSHLQVMSSSLENVLALKILTARRPDDLEKVVLLANRIGLTTAEQMRALVDQVYPGIQILDRSRGALSIAFGG